MGEVANPPIWLRIKILHCTRVMLNHSGHMITHDDKTRPSNLVFLPNMGGGGADVCTWVWGGMCLLWDTQGFTMAGPLNIASDNQHQPSSPCDSKHSLQLLFEVLQIQRPNQKPFWTLQFLHHTILPISKKKNGTPNNRSHLSSLAEASKSSNSTQFSAWFCLAGSKKWMEEFWEQNVTALTNLLQT